MASTENKYIDSSNFATALAVYDDINLTIKAADGTYQYNGEYRTQLNGILGPLIVCDDCIPPPIPCSGTINPPTGNQGLYQLIVSTGETVNDTGAILVYFNPQSVPDGIRVLYDGVYYNRLSSPTDGNLQTTSGVSDAFTILGNSNACVPSIPDTSSYNFFNGYNQGGWVSGTPTPQDVTINTGDDVYGGAGEFSVLVIPKPNATPSDITVQVLGPCSGTAWSISVDCPTDLPSFTGEAIGSSTDCGTTSSTFYFARFKDATNTYPVVNNPVFLDANGSSRATDQNYLMDNDKVITVTNGVVSAIVDCSSAPATAFTASTSYPTQTDACSSSDITNSFYFVGNSPATGKTAYTDSSLTTAFVGDGGRYRIDDSPLASFIIDSSGVLGIGGICQI